MASVIILRLRRVRLPSRLLLPLFNSLQVALSFLPLVLVLRCNCFTWYQIVFVGPIVPRRPKGLWTLVSSLRSVVSGASRTRRHHSYRFEPRAITSHCGFPSISRTIGAPLSPFCNECFSSLPDLVSPSNNSSLAFRMVIQQ